MILLQPILILIVLLVLQHRGILPIAKFKAENPELIKFAQCFNPINTNTDNTNTDKW